MLSIVLKSTQLPAVFCPIPASSAKLSTLLATGQQKSIKASCFINISIGRKYTSRRIPTGISTCFKSITRYCVPLPKTSLKFAVASRIPSIVIHKGVEILPPKDTASESNDGSFMLRTNSMKATAKDMVEGLRISLFALMYFLSLVMMKSTIVQQSRLKARVNTRQYTAASCLSGKSLSTTGIPKNPQLPSTAAIL